MILIISSICPIFLFSLLFFILIICEIIDEILSKNVLYIVPCSCENESNFKNAILGIIVNKFEICIKSVYLILVKIYFPIFSVGECINLSNTSVILFGIFGVFNEFVESYLSVNSFILISIFKLLFLISNKYPLELVRFDIFRISFNLSYLLFLYKIVI